RVAGLAVRGSGWHVAGGRKRIQRHDKIPLAMKRYWAYIMSNKSRRLYVGFSSDLPARVIKHRNKVFAGGFTARYCFDMLVWYEEFSQVVSARMREKEIKGWRREKKLKLVLAENPDWADLSLEWQDDPGWKLLPDARPRIKREPQS
ncbi:MAG: GIY-YIG nuclease family protein, partial [Candidatus Angelobacter sp.]